MGNYNETKKGYNEGWEKGNKEGWEKGMEKGIEKGIEKGLEKNSIDIAKKMKQKGLASDLIAEMTGLSIDIIDKLE